MPAFHCRCAIRESRSFFRLGPGTCPRSDIYSYSESYSYSYSDGVRWHLPAVHLARKPRESVPGVFSRLPPATAVHLITGCCGFSVGHMAVFSMKRATISTPAAAEYMHLSENNDVPKKVQLQVSHVWTHLQYQNRLAGACRAHLSLRVCRVMLHLEMIIPCDCLIIRDFAICAICRCAAES